MKNCAECPYCIKQAILRDVPNFLKDGSVSMFPMTVVAGYELRCGFLREFTNVHIDIYPRITEVRECDIKNKVIKFFF